MKILTEKYFTEDNALLFLQKKKIQIDDLKEKLVKKVVLVISTRKILLLPMPATHEALQQVNRSLADIKAGLG